MLIITTRFIMITMDIQDIMVQVGEFLIITVLITTIHIITVITAGVMETIGTVIITDIGTDITMVIIMEIIGIMEITEIVHIITDILPTIMFPYQEVQL